MVLFKKRVGCVIAYTDKHNNYGTSLQGFATVKKSRIWDMIVK